MLRVSSGAFSSHLLRKDQEMKKFVLTAAFAAALMWQAASWPRPAGVVVAAAVAAAAVVAWATAAAWAWAVAWATAA